MLPLILRDEIAGDLVDGSAWYDMQEPGLGAEFIQEFYNCLDHIQAYPEIHPPVFREFRRTLLARFPFHVYYQPTEAGIVILLLRDARRDDRPIRRILKSRP